MSFQAYVNNIQAKTGKSPDDFRRLAARKGFVENGKIKSAVKPGEVVKWVKDEFGLGHGHAMAVYALLKGVKKENTDEAARRLQEKASGPKLKP